MNDQWRKTEIILQTKDRLIENLLTECTRLRNIKNGNLTIQSSPEYDNTDDPPNEPIATDLDDDQSRNNDRDGDESEKDNKTDTVGIEEYNSSNATNGETANIE